MTDAYRDFMEVCAYTPEEMDKEMPRLKKAFDRMDINEEDLKRGRDRLLKYFQCDLKCMQMVVGEYVRDVVDMSLADDEGKFKIWVELPLVQMTSFMAAAQQARPDVLVGTPAWFVIFVLGAIFQKMDAMQEYAEARWLPAGDAHCGCTKARIGLRKLNYIPTSDFTVSSGILCDEGPKSDELLHHLFGERIFALNRPMDESIYDDPVGSPTLSMLAENIEALRVETSDALGIDLTDEMIKSNLKYWMKTTSLLREISNLRATAEVQPLREAAWNIAFFLTSFNRGKSSYKRMARIFDVMKTELQEKIQKGEGVVPKGSPRIMTGGTPLATPEIPYELEECGINICCHEDIGNKVVTADELDAIFDVTPGNYMYAMSLLMSPLAFPKRRVECITNGYRMANLDGLLLVVYYGCRTLCGPMYMVKDWVCKELGPEVPVAMMENDILDHRYHGIEQLRTRLQTFAEVLHINKEKKGM